jgi:hypothetical protein
MADETQTKTKPRPKAKARPKTKPKTLGGVSAVVRKGALFGESTGPSELQMVAPTAGARRYMRRSGVISG